jgi:sulfoxide reductase heme-binding subunit YedZ
MFLQKFGNKMFKIKNNIFSRHLIIGLIAVSFTFIFWLAHFEWEADMRLWRSFGDSGYTLLFITLIIGPLGKLWPRTNFLIPWRREVGIWFAVLAVTHGLLIANGWANWDVAKFFGYEFIPQLGRIARLEPGFGLANTMGFVAFLWISILALTSSDRAMRWLGASSWKWMHTGSNIVFYLVAIHTSYFLFIHYTESFHKSVPPQSIFVIPFVVMSIAVLVLQISSYIKVVKSKNKKITQK